MQVKKVVCIDKRVILFIVVECWLGDPNTHVNEGKKTWVVDDDEKKIAHCLIHLLSPSSLLCFQWKN